MSYYKDIYNDFPLRCAKLWEKMRSQAEKEKLDVTFMLMTAAAGFVTPFEHLKIQSGQATDNRDHPAFQKHDESHYKKVLNMMEKALGCSIGESSLFAKTSLDDWFYAKTDRIDKIRDLVEYKSRAGEGVKHLKSRRAIKILRNAIAHNNIYAFNRRSVPEIDELAFFAEDRIFNKMTKESEMHGYEVLTIPAQDLGHFLDAWFALLKKAGPKAASLRLAVTEALDANNDQAAA
ncbi:MAG: hypothetical protein ACSHX9_08005 [Luteolibacter sp.]